MGTNEVQEHAEIPAEPRRHWLHQSRQRLRKRQRHWRRSAREPFL